MAWQIELTASARKTLGKLDRQTSQRITAYPHERLAKADDPRGYAKSLQDDWREYWRFRVADYRLICDIGGGVLRVLVVRIAPRKHAYRAR